MAVSQRPRQETETILREASAEHDDVLVAYSGGKDSLAVIDLCSRVFRHLHAFVMVLVPGMRCVAVMIEYARERWGVDVAEYVHPEAVIGLRNTIFCPPTDRLDEKLTTQDVYQAAALDCGARLVATGQRRADYMFRAANAKKAQAIQTVCPIIGWNKFDVKAYLKAQRIPIPEGQKGHSTSGIDLSVPRLLWLYDNFPDDFDRVARVFPYVGAVVARRQFFGIDGSAKA